MLRILGFRHLKIATVASLALLVGSCTIGCEQAQPVVVYTVPTKVPEQLLPGKERMLAAMIPKGQEVWFIKVMGPEDAIGEIESTYREFVRSFKLDNGTPNLNQLPENWRLGAKKQFRFASIDVDTPTKQLDISISKLGRQSDWDGFVLMNVNRWRGQLGLAASEEKWAGGEPIEIDTADATSVWVDLVGDPASGGGMSPPFANRIPPPGQGSPMQSRPPMTRPPPTQDPSTAAASDPRLLFERPEGWRDGRMSTMRLAAFNMGPEDSPAELTVIEARGGLRENVKRWLGQVRQGGVPDEVLDKALSDAQKVDVDGRASQRFLLTDGGTGDGQAIDVTIVPLDGGSSLFVKMQGPAATVSQQADEISSFLESLKFKS